MGGLFCYTYLKDGRRFTPASFWGSPKRIQNLRLRRCFFCFLVLAQASLARPENKKTT